MRVSWIQLGSILAFLGLMTGAILMVEGSRPAPLCQSEELAQRYMDHCKAEEAFCRCSWAHHAERFTCPEMTLKPLPQSEFIATMAACEDVR